MAMKLKILIGVLLAFGAVSSALAQTAGTITFGTNVTTGNGTVTPVLTWSTAPAAQSCVASGGWSGTKAAAGSETLAAISKTATYNITCTWGAKTSVTVRWAPPTTNVDGSSLTDLKGIKVYGGTSPTALTLVRDVGGAVNNVQVTGLTPGTWYFQASAYNMADAESTKSPTPPASIVLSNAQGTKSVGITVNPVPNNPTDVTVE
jgi:hypothetical protein